VTALTESDYRGALDILRIAHESDDAVPFSGNMLAALRRLIPSAIATSQEWDPTLGYRIVVDGANRADFGQSLTRVDLCGARGETGWSNIERLPSESGQPPYSWWRYSPARPRRSPVQKRRAAETSSSRRNARGS
jgi:hypothetical protein